MEAIVDLSGKSFLVTGAGQGIGRAVAELCLRLGANVVAVDLNGDGLREIEAGAADRVLTAQGSITDAGFVQEVVARCCTRFGGIDGLVNNAGITRPAMIAKMTLEQWQQVIDVHLTGSFHCLQAVGLRLIEQAKAGRPGGAIVNVSSDAGRKGTVGQLNYGTAKAGTLGMTMSAALEWARYGIRVNTVAFGVVETPMTEVVRGEKFRDTYMARIPLGRWSTPAEVAKPIAFLLSDAASYITGQHLGINGGAHMAG
ncbi:MAG: SDR family NAD(P)-dependent oxidoreductase [Janthinobacterium lividum]